MSQASARKVTHRSFTSGLVLSECGQVARIYDIEISFVGKKVTLQVGKVRIASGTTIPLRFDILIVHGTERGVVEIRARGCLWTREGILSRDVGIQNLPGETPLSMLPPDVNPW